MTKEQVSDSFNVLTNHVLREAYDKHNLFYSEKDFVEKKHKSISNIEKYMLTAKGVLAVAPYFFIMFLALSAHSNLGRKLVVTGLLLTMYVVFELKKPGPVGDDSEAVKLVESYRKHAFVVKMLGDEATDRFTIHQLCNFI